MVAFLARILNIVRYSWVVLRDLGYSALAIILVPLALLVVAAYLGGVSWYAKLVAIEIEWLLVTVGVIWLTARHAKAVGAVALGVAATDPGAARPLIGDAREAIGDALRLVAAILATEFIAGIIVLLAPIHANIVLSLLGIPIAMTFVGYWVWQGGAPWWPKVVWWLNMAALVAVLTGLIMPYAFPGLTQDIVGHAGSLDGNLRAAGRGEASPLVVFLLVVLAIVLRKLLLAVLKPPYQAAVGGAIFWLIVAGVVSWFVLGAGGGAAGGSASAPPRSPRLVATPHLGVQMIEVPLYGFDRLTPVGNLTRSGFCWGIKPGSARISAIKFADSAGEQPFSSAPAHVGWRDVAALRGEGTVMLEIFRPVRVKVVERGKEVEVLSCKPEDAL